MFSYGFKRRSYQFYNRGRTFFSRQWAGGVVLLFFVVVALILANLPATRDIYHDLVTIDIGISIGGRSLDLDLERFVNDGLMMIFFFVVGLEIKREVIAGHLSSFRKAILPIAGALGGMIVPALIYVLFNHGTEYSAGWGIPMATDIAFAIAILSVMGNKVPVSLKIFLTALAVADDLGAIIVIALFYGTKINYALLIAAAGVLVVAYLLNRFKVSSFLPWVLISVVLWFLFYHSGIHATIAGVLLAMFIPSKPKYNKKYFWNKLRYLMDDFRHNEKYGDDIMKNERQYEDLHKIGVIAADSTSLSQRFEHLLDPWVTFLIIPLFALVNAGVPIHSVTDLNIFATTQGQGIFFGLCVGKPLGITLMSLLFVKLKIAEMPEGADWKKFVAVACLGGIGFTMSIFMDNLAFAAQPEFIASGKIAILIASAVAAMAGYMGMKFLCRSEKHPAGPGKSGKEG